MRPQRISMQHERKAHLVLMAFVFELNRLTVSHRQVRSTTTRAAAIQRTRAQFGRRAFSVCDPDVWCGTVFLHLSAPSTPTRSSAVLSKLICSSSLLTINGFYFSFYHFWICSARSAGFYLVWLGIITFLSYHIISLFNKFKILSEFVLLITMK